MAKIEVTMPKMGESITEGTVISWHKEPGDAVEMDEILLEIGTDKVDTDVPSPAEGVLAEILVEEGATVDVGTTIAYIETEVEAGEGESSDEAPPAEDAQEVSGSDAETDEASEAEAEPVADEDSSSDERAGADDSGEATGEASGEASKDMSGDAGEVEPHLDVKPTGGGRVEVVMPKMGESITEGTVLTWHKQPGDEVDLDETLLEIGTDKVDTEVPSPSAGVLSEILVEENETVDVGTPLAIIATGEAATDTPEEAPQQPDESAERSAPTGDGEGAGKEGEGAGDRAGEDDRASDGAARDIPRKASDGRFFSPLVRSIAEKEGLSVDELESIEGTGRDGRVTKEDVLAYLEDRAEAKTDKKATTERKSTPSASPAEQRKEPASPEPVAQSLSDGDVYDGRVEVVKMDRMRQIIAEHMVRSKATSAHVTSFAEADVTNLVKFREANKEEFQEREGVKLTYTPFFVHAAVDALREYPILNASVMEEEIVIKKDLHIGIAVAIGNAGLVAPVIRSAGQKSVAGLAHAAADLAERARSKHLQPDELQGGTFTITNIGSLGSLMGTPIINQPQVGILAVGAIKKRPVVIEDPDLGDIIAVRHMVYLSLSYDHRIIDGAVGSAFLQRFASALESVDADFEL
ncbi:MAG: 2-oxoglutarate dehydrogenase, E2 component, dihydrolipoamide succinyltransferase [Rhodothermales bacterium]